VRIAAWIFIADQIYQVFATVVASLSSVTALVYMAVLALSSNLAIHLLFPWDFVIFVLWAAVFGIFGKLYIGTTAPYDGGIQRMKNAVWVDCTNMILWFISAVGGLVIYFTTRRDGGMSLHTGRAKV
jgi:H+/Cl- antiporter ClcA